MKMRLIKTFLSDRSGNATMVFGLTLIPALVVMGGALDLGRARFEQSRLQGAADAAVIAAIALPKDATDAQRISTATSVFSANYTKSTPTVTVSGETVSLSATNNVPTTLLSLAHINSITVTGTAQSAATYKSAETSAKACLLALDPASTDGIHIQGTNAVNYDGCWGYTNSAAATAINSSGNGTATGAGHCAVGSYSVVTGSFTPTPKSACEPMPDPFASIGAYDSRGYLAKFAPPAIPDTCMATNLSLKKGSYILSPGRYCGGIDMKAQANVTLLPGVYIIDNGLLNVQSGSSIAGANVLLYFSGANARYTIIGGGTINLKGRATGQSYAGFLFIAHPNAWRGLASNIQGGGSLNMEGVIYTPTQRLEVSGNGDVNGSTKYFGVVAKDFYFRGNGTFNFKKYGSNATVPDIMPKVPDARTVSLAK